LLEADKSSMRRPDIEVALRGRTLSLWGSWRELRKLPEYLHPDERVDDVTAANFGETGGRSLIVATNERILIIKDGWIFKNSQGIAYSGLRSVEIKTGLILSEISFVGDGIEINTTKTGRWSGKRIVHLIRERIGSRYNSYQNSQAALGLAGNAPLNTTSIAAPSASLSNPLDFSAPQSGLNLHTVTTNQANSAATPPASQDNFLSQMERLSALRASGALSEVEFQNAKNKLLHEY